MWLLHGAGGSLAAATPLADMTRLSGDLESVRPSGPGHVYRAECPAGTRLRVQMLTPALPVGRALTPAVALVAQGDWPAAKRSSCPSPSLRAIAPQTLAPPKRQQPMKTTPDVGGYFPAA